jgi:large subunit ribosomal protein L15
MQMNELKRRNPNKKSKRIGRGGLRGKTSGRGHKGQKQHGGHGIRAEIRGKNSNKSIHPNNVAINVAIIEANFKAGEVVSPMTLKEKGIINGASARKASVKILGNGDLSKKVMVEGCLVSTSAADKISKAGGSVA